jgi:diguanylate cyclase (GGDEF)-like protein
MGAMELTLEHDGDSPLLSLPFLRELKERLFAPTNETVQQVLAYAAEKEQTLAEQRTRIAELERLIETDELTSLLNRRGFDAAAQRVLANAARHAETGVLMLIDVDGFKRINDRHGHAAGDAALKLVGKTLAGHIRATDYAARLGGDEFALLWVRAEPAALRARIRKLRRVLDSLILEWGPAKVPLKASAGLAVYGPDTPLQDLFERADTAMYRAKRIRRR